MRTVLLYGYLSPRPSKLSSPIPPPLPSTQLFDVDPFLMTSFWIWLEFLRSPLSSSDIWKIASISSVRPGDSVVCLVGDHSDQKELIVVVFGVVDVVTLSVIGFGSIWGVTIVGRVVERAVVLGDVDVVVPLVVDFGWIGKDVALGVVYLVVDFVALIGTRVADVGRVVEFALSTSVVDDVAFFVKGFIDAWNGTGDGRVLWRIKSTGVVGRVEFKVVGLGDMWIGTGVADVGRVVDFCVVGVGVLVVRFEGIWDWADVESNLTLFCPWEIELIRLH